MPIPPTTRKRKQRGAVMVETCIILPFLFIIFVLILYIGWNMRRIEKTTMMDRYEVWRQTTPGSQGPAQNNVAQHAQLNDAFFGDTGDDAERLSHDLSRGRTQIPEAHRLLQQQLSDESFAYYRSFLDASPTGIYERFEAQHRQISPLLARTMSDVTRNPTGHTRLDGDWRFGDGIAFNRDKQKWEPNGRRVVPGTPLREVFFVELDDGLSPYTSSNPLAEAIREFYTRYPAYVGPEIPTRWTGGGSFGF